MALAAGTCLGPYEVVSSLGAGGMGEVYRARDPRLGRDVAIKVIGGEGSPNPERLRRFEQEARSVAALQHPHILAVHDIGTHEGRPYLVLELLEGETLRERLSRGALPVRKATEVAVQICDGLAAAHAHGVVHRDLKPENVFLVREGGVKLLDFGLAKLLEAGDEGGSEAATETATDRGVWVGTAGYVSPEQLRGQGATARSDVFAVGAVLYEMLTGQRAFRGATKADTLAAILEKDPPAMTLAGGAIPLPLERVVLRCLEKDADDRFQSARDVAFALEALSTGSRSEPGPTRPAARSRRWPWAPAGLLGVAAVAGIAFVAGRRAAEKPAPTFKQLTFRRGWLDNARFAPDGRTVIYGAGWDGKPAELFQTRTDSPESRPLGLVHAEVQSISAQGQMAILLDPTRRSGDFELGTLAVVPLAGGTPRELLEDVTAADWTPDGRELCVCHVQPNGEIDVELPPGTVLDWIPRARTCDFLHVSRDGRYVVFRDGAASRIVLADRERKVARALVEPLGAHWWGLAWGPTGREVWFTEGAGWGARDVHAVDLEGRRRLVYRSTGTLGLVDSAPDGRMLFHRSLDRYAAMALLPGSRMERDVTVNDNSFIGALSADGRLLLLNSVSEGTGFSVYLRRDGGDPVRIAAGRGVDISPDGRSTLVVDNEEFSVVPIGPGLPRKVNLGTLRAEGGTWVPSPHGGLIVRGRERPDEPYRFWLIDEAGARARKLDAGAFGSRAISPDGETLAARTALDTIGIIPLAGGRARAIRVGDPHLGVGRWSADGRSLFLARGGSWPCEIHRLDLATGKTELWKQASPPDATGMVWCAGILPSADGESYVYVANRSLASLIVAEGLR